MNEYEKIVEFVFNNPGCRNKDIMRFFINLLSGKERKETIEVRINRKLTKLKGKKVLCYNFELKQPRYSINPLIENIKKNWTIQIKLGLKKKEECEKLLEISFFKEAELRDRITNSKISKISKDFGDLTNDVFMTNEANFFFSNIFYSFLREGVMFNPELWEKLTKPKHYNFRFEIKCNWEKDPQIFILINELKNLYKKIGYIPHNTNSPFHREKEIPLNKKNDKELYMNAVSQETIRQLTEKKVVAISKNFQNDFDPLLNSFKYLSKEIEANVPELKDLSNIFDLPLLSDKFKKPTIEERKEVSEKYLNSLKQLKNKIFSFLEIED